VGFREAKVLIAGKEINEDAENKNKAA